MQWITAIFLSWLTLTTYGKWPETGRDFRTEIGGSEPARFIGGEKAFLSHIANNLIYPTDARNAGVEGRVFIKFTVNADSSVSDLIVVGEKIGYGLEEESIRVIQSTSGLWIPGKDNGQPSRTTFQIPISFSLNGLNGNNSDNKNQE